jgi:hypothetical protein
MGKVRPGRRTATRLSADNPRRRSVWAPAAGHRAGGVDVGTISGANRLRWLRSLWDMLDFHAADFMHLLQVLFESEMTVGKRAVPCLLK